MIAWCTAFAHWLFSFTGLLWFAVVSVPAVFVTRLILAIWDGIEAAARDL